MLTALFIQHDQGFHAHLVTLQHNNDVTIARQRTQRTARRARPARAAPRRPHTTQLTTKQNKIIHEHGHGEPRRGRRRSSAAGGDERAIDKRPTSLPSRSAERAAGLAPTQSLELTVRSYGSNINSTR